jgi:hypothetical protein
MAAAAKTPTVDVLKEAQAATKALAPAAKRLAKALSTLAPERYAIGAVADLLYDLRQTDKLLGTLRAPFDDVIGPAVKALEEHFVQTLAVGESSGVQGHAARVQVTESLVPVVEDWPKFYAYIGRTKSYELLNRAVNRASVQERWEAKKQVPGVGVFHAKKVSCTKLSGKGGK